MSSPLDGLQEEQEKLSGGDDFDELKFEGHGGRPSPFSGKRVLFSAPGNVSIGGQLTSGTEIPYTSSSPLPYSAFLLIRGSLRGVSDAWRLQRDGPV